ncbi:MAG: DUF4136 domain-containing protein, partial [Dysgonamonadaceae bacterium]|nr:DUF4136 domain-containing protein [Dysgonamonadaceae bacterium]
AENIIANKVKADLANKGCSFVENAEEADFVLKIEASTREFDGAAGNFVYAYADVTVDLYDNHRQKSIYQDKISQKSGSKTLEKAARQAMETVPKTIIEKILNFITN